MKPARQQRYTTVLFDIGGVLAGDLFEHVLFDRRHGLAPRGWLARRRWRAAASDLWGQFALRPDASEAEFWRAMSARVGADIAGSAAVASERRALRVNHQVAKLLPALRSAGLHVGLVSDNTAFWYAKQMSALGRLPVEPGLTFLSFQLGRTKAGGLYAATAAKLDPAATLVVEDRPALRRAARAAGFQVARYSLTTGRSLSAALRRAGVELPNIES